MLKPSPSPPTSSSSLSSQFTAGTGITSFISYKRNSGKGPKPGPALDPLPVVTIQLPLYNEMYVADRLIEAVCRIEYPRERLEIQVLDDSTDETRSIAERAIRRLSEQGIDIKYLPPRRSDRVTKPGRSKRA